ncbi:MAG: hypothetical protein NT004_13095 [Bacteroidetes bacterium]|nr:hypothetical protein [Bacteroidota bacterium]
MNIQARKLLLIEEFLRISDESIIERLESLIKVEKKKHISREIKPMSLTELHEMIDQAKFDKENGRVVLHQDLKRKVKSWK